MTWLWFVLLLPAVLHAEGTIPDTTRADTSSTAQPAKPDTSSIAQPAKPDTTWTTWTEQVMSERGVMTVEADSESVFLRARKRVTLVAFLGVLVLVYSSVLVFYALT